MSVRSAAGEGVDLVRLVWDLRGGWLPVGRGPCPAHTAAFTPRKKRRKWESTWPVGRWGGPVSLPSPRERAAWGGRDGPPRAASRDAAEEVSITSEAASVKWTQDSPGQVVAG